jgi:hypothetical protein
MKSITIKNKQGEILHKETIHDPLMPLDKPCLKEKIKMGDETFYVTDVLWTFSHHLERNVEVIVDLIKD